MPRLEPFKVIENPLAGAPSSEDELGEEINEARIPLLRHSVKRHSTPSTIDDRRGFINIGTTNSPVAQPIYTGPSSQYSGHPDLGNEPLPRSNSKSGGLSPGGSGAGAPTYNILTTTANGTQQSSGITQSQSLQVFGHSHVKSSQFAGKYTTSSTATTTATDSSSVHHSQQRSAMGNVVVVSDKEGGKPTSGYLPPSAGKDPSFISESSSLLPSVASNQYQHSGSNSQTSCFQDDGFCMAVTKLEGTLVDTSLVKVTRIGNQTKNAIAETKIMMANSNVDDPGGGGEGSRSDMKKGSSLDGGSRLDLNLSTSTLRPNESDPAGEADRETWSQGLDFLLSIIGFAVDLANVWRFPYFCYKNGGGAFLIPYFLMLALSAIPVFYMELLLGQSIRQGPISMWKICPLFKGVGYCAVTVSYFVSFYYNTIMCWSLHFTISSFTSPLPWSNCNNSWNTESCYSPEIMGQNGNMISNQSSQGEEDYYPYNESFMPNMSHLAPSLEKLVKSANASNATTSPASEYFRNSVLDMRGHDIDNLGSPKVDLLVCLAVIYCLLYVILFRGIRSTGKVVYVTALLPYLVMFILLIRGVMLPGAVNGMYYYLVPNMTKLYEISVWSDAAKQIFFSSGAGFGVHLTYASYNNFHNNCYRDCLVTSCVNCFTSIFSGFVIFTFLGSMAHRQNRPIEEVVNVGPGLVFEVYPEAVGALPGANFWSLLFFIMLIMLGIDSAMGGLECVITGITDEFKTFFKKKKHGRECFMFFIVLISFLIGIINVTRGGMYTFTFLDTYAAGSSLLLSVLFEILAVSWVYGLDQLCKDAEAMLGFQPGIYWRVCWKFVSPLLIATIIILDLSQAGELTHEDYTYPNWAQIFGYIFTFIPITLVPIIGFIEFMKYPGDCMTKLSYAITPVSEHAAIKEGGRIRRLESAHWTGFRWRK